MTTFLLDSRGWRIALTLDSSKSPPPLEVAIEVMTGGGVLQHCALVLGFALGGVGLGIDLGELADGTDGENRDRNSLLRTKGLVDGLPRAYASLLPEALTREATRLQYPSGEFVVRGAGYDPIETSSGSFWRAGTIGVWVIKALIESETLSAESLQSLMDVNWVGWPEWRQGSVPVTP